MELKVWVEGIQRIVCGVSETTTCQDVVFALAHATGKSGRFTLIERWRNNERQLSPQENPLKVLLKWGEYSNDVQFILKRTDSSKTAQINHTKASPASNLLTQLPRLVHNQKGSQLFGGENVGVIKGIPKPFKTLHLEVKDDTKSSSRMAPNVRENPGYYSNSPHNSPKKSNSSFSSTGTESPKPRPAPPPYRDPPPPSSNVNFKRNLCQEGNLQKKNWQDNQHGNSAEASYSNQYRELVALINSQKEKLSGQQADLTKFDSEIVLFENKEREKHMQLDFIAQELIQVSNQSKVAQEQIQALSYVEEESEIVKQQEKTLKSEITLLRSKLANCETELLQCKNKIRLLMDELHTESRIQNKTSESRKQFERNILIEIERLQKDIESARQNSDLHYVTADTLKTEVIALEVAINEKKKQVEALVTEMKEANLLSLSIAPPDDIGLILEGPKQRKMVGSPRQLETAVPTSKNPHGVWV